MLHIINICFGVFCICSPRKYFIFQTGVLDTHPARAPQPSCAWECHQLNEKQRWREKDLLGGSLQGPQRSDSARWMQQDFFFGGGGMLDGGGPSSLGVCAPVPGAMLRDAAMPSSRRDPRDAFQSPSTAGVGGYLQLQPGKTNPSQRAILKPNRPGFVIAQSAYAGRQEQLI